MRGMGKSGMPGTTDAATAEPPSMKERPRRAGFRVRDGMGHAIGQALQAHYDNLVAAPMPDRFLVLLAELEAREKQRG